MALADFIQALQEQDVVYSEPSKSSIRVIPPENPSLRVLPPETVNDVKTETIVNTKVEPHVSNNDNVSAAAPKVIKLKIKKKQVEEANQPASSFNNVEQPKINSVNTQKEIKETNKSNIIPEQSTNTTKITNTESTIETIKQPIVTEITVEKPVVTETVIEQPKELTDDDIFNSTGTEYSKKDLWFDFYMKAKNSRKKNPIVDRMKVGRFTLTPDNKVLLLPDYDIVGKDPDDVLKDKWF